MPVAVLTSASLLVESEISAQVSQWLCNCNTPCALENRELWEKAACSTATCVIGAFICYCPKRNQGIKWREDSELPPGGVTLKRLMSSHDDCTLPWVSRLEHRFISKLSILEISSAGNEWFWRAMFSKFPVQKHDGFTDLMACQKNRAINDILNCVQKRPFQIHIKYLIIHHQFNIGKLRIISDDNSKSKELNCQFNAQDPY